MSEILLSTHPTSVDGALRNSRPRLFRHVVILTIPLLAWLCSTADAYFSFAKMMNKNTNLSCGMSLGRSGLAFREVARNLESHIEVPRDPPDRNNGD